MSEKDNYDENFELRSSQATETLPNLSLKNQKFIHDITDRQEETRGASKEPTTADTLEEPVSISVRALETWLLFRHSKKP